MKKFRAQDQPEVEIINDSLEGEEGAALLESAQSENDSTELAAAHPRSTQRTYPGTWRQRQFCSALLGQR